MPFLGTFSATLRYSKPIRYRGVLRCRMRCGGPIAIVWCRMACDDELPLISLLRRPAKQRRRIGPLKVAENGVSAISPLSPFAHAKGFPASLAQEDAGAIAPARAVEERTVALRGFPETRRQWERCDLRGTRNRRRPSCCETLAPLTVLSPGPRLAGTPAKGLKIWDQVGFDLPTHVRVNPQNGGKCPP
jgi:hypothetical protein